LFVRRESRALPYTPDQLFGLAADVERYSDFVPWWIAARVHDRQHNGYETDQIVGIGTLRFQFRSRTALHPPHRIVVTASDGPVRTLRLSWQFSIAETRITQVDLDLAIELRPRFVHDLFARRIAAASPSLLTAFEAQAHRQFAGRTAGAIPSQDLPADPPPN